MMVLEMEYIAGSSLSEIGHRAPHLLAAMMYARACNSTSRCILHSMWKSVISNTAHLGRYLLQY